MYPDILFLGLDFYDIFFAAGIVSSIVIFTKYTTKQNMPNKVQSFYLNLSMAAIFAGMFSSFFFQAVYNFFSSGKFYFQGVTFLGGFVGGAVTFLAGYKIFGKDQDKKYFPMVADAVPCAVLLGHALGRIGCFMAGCCHGKQTDSIFGVKFPHLSYNVFPTQIYESIFLFIMFGICSVLFLKKKGLNLPLYLISYGAFRFLLEFLRGDYRGDFIISFLSPSQTISLIMVFIGIYLLLNKKIRNKLSYQQLN